MEQDVIASQSLTVQPHGWQCSVDTGSTLLQAALRAGIVLPSSCRNGTCRTCMCRMTSGRIHYLIAWPGLSAEEKAEGWILPCIAHPDSDVTIDMPAARKPSPPDTAP
jgi:ferredoxin